MMKEIAMQTIYIRMYVHVRISGLKDLHYVCVFYNYACAILCYM